MSVGKPFHRSPQLLPSTNSSTGLVYHNMILRMDRMIIYILLPVGEFANRNANSIVKYQRERS